MASSTQGPQRRRSTSGDTGKGKTATSGKTTRARGTSKPTTTTGRRAAKGTKNTKGTKAATAASEADTRIGYYREMVLIREFELRAGEMYTRAKIGGYCHLNLGEEPTVVGLMAALRPTDYLFTNYREHGYALSRGMDPGRVMAELFGRIDGVSAGRGGSMHLFDASRRFLGGYGIVGGQLPPATGAALALTYRGGPGPDAEAVMCQMGDGTTNIGAFHESLNLAAIWNLPIVYVIVNNGLGMATTVEMAAGEPLLYKRGCSYRIEGRRVDGDDPAVVYEAAAEMLRAAREERTPGLLEVMSHRLRGHSVVDPAKYRSREETEELRKQDPVPAYRSALIADGVFDDAAAEAIEAEVEAEVTRAVKFADASPEPDAVADELFRFTYATDVPNISRLMPGDPVLPSGWDQKG